MDTLPHEHRAVYWQSAEGNKRKPHHLYVLLSLDEGGQTLLHVEIKKALLLLVFIEARGSTFMYKVVMRFVESGRRSCLTFEV